MWQENREISGTKAWYPVAKVLQRKRAVASYAAVFVYRGGQQHRCRYVAHPKFASNTMPHETRPTAPKNTTGENMVSQPEGTVVTKGAVPKGSQLAGGQP